MAVSTVKAWSAAYNLELEKMTHGMWNLSTKGVNLQLRANGTCSN